MGRAAIQTFKNKIGEVTFRRKLVKQHQGKKIFFESHTTAKQNLDLLKERAKQTKEVFKRLVKTGIVKEPFLEIGAEKCERAAVIIKSFGLNGFANDISLESLISADSLVKPLGFKKLPFRVCADAYNLPFADNSLPFVFTYQTLHHFPDPLPIFKEVYRVLMPGGYFFFNEEPIKQKVNLNLWKRDWRLNPLEKVLKAMLILPFIAGVGKSEVEHGVLEEAFEFCVWERALNTFESVEAKVNPVFLGPARKRIKNGKADWLKPDIFTLSLIHLQGGGISALCRKGGEKYSKKSEDLESFLICPECHKGKLERRGKSFVCAGCKTDFPIISKVSLMLNKRGQKELYGKKV